MSNDGYHFEKRYQPTTPAKFSQSGWVGVVPVTNEEHRTNGACLMLVAFLGAFVGVIAMIVIYSL